MIKGIDVSTFQKIQYIDYSKIKKAGIDFVMMRAGYGNLTSQKDEQFENHYASAKKYGLHTGCYWFSYAMSADEAKLEAQAFLNVIKGKKFEYPVCIDIEYPKQLGLGTVAVSAIAEAFCVELESAGYYAMIYVSANVARSLLTDAVRNRFDIWIAHYGVDKPNYDGKYGLWQYTSEGLIDGYNSYIDCDYAYKDYSTVMKQKGLNEFKKATASSQTYIVKWGDTLSRIARNNNTTVAKLCQLNGITNPDKIYAGQTIRIN